LLQTYPSPSPRPSLVRLRKVFTRFREKRLIASPEKTVINVPKKAFVGNKIDKEGKHFTKEKLDKVIQVELPMYGKGLRSFLGLTDWFVEHVHDNTSRCHVLQLLVRDYENTKIVWTQNAKDAFEDIKAAVMNARSYSFSKRKGRYTLKQTRRTIVQERIYTRRCGMLTHRSR
jgi:hypothetical protein